MMITTVLRRSLLDTSRKTLSASLTSGNAALSHHLTPAAARVSDHPPTKNPFGVKAREFHFQSGPPGFRASMVSPAGFAISERIGDSEMQKVSKAKISPENDNPLSRNAIALQKEAAESTSKIRGTRICIAIRSFLNPEKQAWCLPPHTRKVAIPDTRTLYTVLRSPHVDKKSREQFEMRFKKRFLVIKAQSHELSKKLFWLKRYRILGAQYELQFHCKTRLDMTPVLANINGSTNAL